MFLRGIQQPFIAPTAWRQQSYLCGSLRRSVFFQEMDMRQKEEANSSRHIQARPTRYTGAGGHVVQGGVEGQSGPERACESEWQAGSLECHQPLLLED